MKGQGEGRHAPVRGLGVDIFINLEDSRGYSWGC
jgi:hypothetical protein